MIKKIILTALLIVLLPALMISTAVALNETQATYATVHVLNTAPVINSVGATPDPVDPSTTITIKVNATDDNQDITEVWATLDMGTGGTGDDVSLQLTYNGGTGLYENTHGLAYDAAPGTWTIAANVTDGASVDNDSGTFTVNGVVNLALINTPIDFGNASVGDTDNSAEVGTGFPLTMNNTGNVNVTFETKGEDLQGQTQGSYNIGVGNLKVYHQNSVGSASALSTSYQQVGSQTSPGNTEDAYFWITIPNGLPEQEYQGNVTVMALQV